MYSIIHSMEQQQLYPRAEGVSVNQNETLCGDRDRTLGKKALQSESMADTRPGEEPRIPEEWGKLCEEFSVELHGRLVHVSVYYKPYNTQWNMYTTVNVETGRVINQELCPV